MLQTSALLLRACRVGIVRKLKWGATLKKDAPGAYRLDMTVARFKNSRFYGVRLRALRRARVWPFLVAPFPLCGQARP